MRLYWSPEKFSTSISLSEHNQISTQRTGNTTPTYSFNLDRKYSMNYRLTKNIKMSYTHSINSNFDDYADTESLKLDSYILDALNCFVIYFSCVLSSTTIIGLSVFPSSK